jgi:acetyl-CoA carboxylase biotin carboxyl carrier protein
MRIADIADIVTRFSAAGLATCELTGPNFHIFLGRSHEAPPADKNPTRSGRDNGNPGDDRPDLVSSPGVGLFMHGHPVHEAALAVPNEPVLAGQPLGYLRVGPVLLPVVSPRDGVVASVEVRDGSLVGYGDPLVALFS